MCVCVRPGGTAGQHKYAWGFGYQLLLGNHTPSFVSSHPPSPFPPFLPLSLPSPLLPPHCTALLLFPPRFLIYPHPFTACHITLSRFFLTAPFSHSFSPAVEKMHLLMGWRKLSEWWELERWLGVEEHNSMEERMEWWGPHLQTSRFSTFYY